MKEPLGEQTKSETRATLKYVQESEAIRLSFPRVNLYSSFRYLFKAQRKVYPKPQTLLYNPHGKPLDTKPPLWHSGCHYQSLSSVLALQNQSLQRVPQYPQ